MKITYHIREFTPTKYEVTTKIPFGSSGIDITTMVNGRFLTVENLLTKAKANIRSRMWLENAKNPSAPTAAGTLLVWDEDRSDMKTFNYNVKEVDTSDCVYEVDCVSGVWTIVKHDAPLMTYPEACAALFKLLTKED